MNHVGRETFRQIGEKRVVPGGIRLAQGDGADLDATRMPGRLAAQRMGQELVAVTDAQHRHAFANANAVFSVTRSARFKHLNGMTAFNS